MVDAVVIGSGINGLVAAAALAQAGWRVAVFERADTPGGAVRTREATLPGFRHDMGAMNLSLFAGSAFHRRHAARLARHGLAFAPVRDCFATAFPDRRWLGVSTDLNLTAARIGGASRADAAAWRAMVAGFPALAPHLFALLGAPATPGRLARTAFGIWRNGGAGTLRQVGRLLLSSPRDFLDGAFESDRVKALLAAWGMHLDFPPDAAGGALFPYLEGMANQSFGMVLGRGGADTVVRALTAMIAAKGGTVECGAEVAEVLTGGMGARGVRLADGRRVTAKRAVIANIGPRALARLLPGGSGDTGYDRAAAGFAHGPGTMMLHLALDDLPDWAAGRELRRFAYVHLAPSLRQMAGAYAEAMEGLLPREPVLVVGQPTAIDPTRAPPGRHVLWVQVRVVPGTIRGDAAGTIAARDWEQAKAPMAERVLDLLEGYAPGLRDRILGMAVVSPADLEAENPNLVGGDQICGSHHLCQNWLNRPIPGWADGSTPVKRLHLTGAACWPGAGVGAGAGTLLAERLLRRS
jgi:phytoene dehydrogenase-like protein